jgi:hypothetical protein
MPLSINKDLAKEWRPTRARIRKIEKHLITRSGGCLSWDSGDAGIDLRGGVGKKKKRDIRLVFKKRKFTARILLYVWESGTPDVRCGRPRCGNWWCLSPSHQICKS